MDQMGVIVDDFQDASWRNVFLLLSLEKAVRFWPEMGLSGACADLRKLSQEYCIASEEIEAKGSLGGKQKADVMLHLLRSTLERLSACCGAEFVAEFVLWARTVFSTNRQLTTQPFLWTQILRNAGRQGQNGLRDLDVEADKKIELLDAISEIVNQKDIHQQVRQTEKEPTGTWDAQKFAEYTDGASPLDMVKEATLRHRFGRAWCKINSVFTQDNICHLLAWAKIEADRMKIPSELVDIPPY